MDRLHVPHRKGSIPGYDAAREAALEVGAAAVTISGAGPSLIAFTANNHEVIAKAMCSAVENSSQTATRSWVLPVDSSGIAIEVG